MQNPFTVVAGRFMQRAQLLVVVVDKNEGFGFVRDNFLALDVHVVRQAFV